MCGISLIINKNNNPVSFSEISKMNDLISHRGPDDCGYFHGRNFSLGHRRLAILDLSSNGHQPMTYQNNYTIVFNGEIYNYLEIREQLKTKGYLFSSNSDTEVILAAYIEWGKDCVNLFNGMWSFVIYDAQKEMLFCSRDRFGIKPFYYLETPDQFIAGSEIKQLLRFNNKNRVNYKTLVDYVVCNFVEHREDTFFSDICKLLPAHNLIYDLKTGKFNIYKYYKIHIDKHIAELSEPQAIELYKEKLYNAIQLRLRSDVTIGTCLSGGLDSSTVATIAGNRYNQSSDSLFNAITAKSIEPDTDESEFARLVVENGKLHSNTVTPSTVDFVDSMEDVISLQEEPFGSPSIFMQFFVMQKAKEIGCTVMLDGQGGDETLLGYERYYPTVLLEFCRRNGLIYSGRELLKSCKNNANLSLINVLKFSIFGMLPFVRKRFYLQRCPFIRLEFLNEFMFLDQLAKSNLNIEQLQILEIEKNSLPGLLRYEDRNSMYHSIEARLPFIDYQLLETALSLPISCKTKDGWSKYTLRKIMKKSMPNRVVWRRNKLGFAAPESIWLKHYRPVMLDSIRTSDLLNHISYMNLIVDSFDQLDNKLLWRLFNVAIWAKLYNVCF